MKKIRRFFIFACWVIILAACGGQRYEMGLDSVTQGGRWMSVLQPVQDSSPQVAVINLQTGSHQLTLTNANIYLNPIVIFSPSGDYLLYRDEEMWILVEIASMREWKITLLDGSVEFLSDDEILISRRQLVTSEDGSRSESLYELSLVSPLSPESAPDIITTKGRYIFKSQTQGLSGVMGASLASSTPAQAFCPPTNVISQNTYVIVDNDGTVRVLSSNRQKSVISRLEKLSFTITDLLRRHEALQEALAIQELQKITQNQEMAEAEKAAYVDAIAHSGITGVVSPDGRRLLLLTATGISTEINQYYLHLINLETSNRIPLSSATDWTPAFLFSPDGRQIIFESNSQGDRAWYLGSSDGSQIVRLSIQGITALCWH
jgi:hypothetical protein